MEMRATGRSFGKSHSTISRNDQRSKTCPALLTRQIGEVALEVRSQIQALSEARLDFMGLFGHLEAL